MNAPGDEERVESRSGGARDIGLHPVADGEHAALVERRAARPLRKRQRPIIDRRIGLAGVDDRAANLLVPARERAGAIDERLAAMDDDVRIGADHRHVRAPPSRAVRTRNHRPSRSRRLVGRCKGVIGLVEGDEPRPRAGRLCGGLEQAEIAVGPDVEDGRSSIRSDEADGHVARGRDGVERVRRDAELQQLAADRRRAAAERW